MLSVLGTSRIGDNKKVSQIEMLPDEQLLVLISGNTCYICSQKYVDETETGRSLKGD